MVVPAAGENAAQLPWLWPEARSLTVLAQPLSPDTWTTLRRDPGALLLVLRQRFPDDFLNAHPAIEPARFLEPRILQTALDWFQHDTGSWVDWRQPCVLPIYKAALAIACHARLIALQAHCCDPAAAWAAGLLAPLGWFAMAATRPDLAASCLSEPQFQNDPHGTQLRYWGIDSTTIARRLARRWQLPDWLRAAIGLGNLPMPAAEALGADPSLFAVVQLAIAQASREGYSLGLSQAPDQQRWLAWLRLDAEDLETVRTQFQTVELDEAFDPAWRDPRGFATLPTQMRLAMERRRSEAAPFVGLLERDLERMHDLLLRTNGGTDESLRDAKLEARLRSSRPGRVTRSTIPSRSSPDRASICSIGRPTTAIGRPSNPLSVKRGGSMES